jgi:site-specific recombinase XerD
LLTAHADHQRQERGLSEATVVQRRWFLRRFLGRLGATKGSLRRLGIAEIQRVLMEQIAAGHYARATVKVLTSSLRDFFRFLEMRGACRPGLAIAITGPRIFAQEGLPLGPSWNKVQELIATADGDDATHIRDRAILLLLAVYGLRPGEVVNLRMEDFDWERELLLVRRPKVREAHRYPLARAVGDAVIRYLREARPRSSHREVFLLARAPFRPMRSGVWRVVARRLGPLGAIIVAGGPRALRHACATHLLQHGLPLKEIGDHLGHRRADTTRIYAKVDIEALRTLSLPWPGGAQ